jgi:uncharacterized protein YndB with AHSA1/START domain
MTGDMLHAVEVHAAPHTLFEAIATQRGQAAFWTADALVQPAIGSVAEFGFPGAPVKLKMRVERLEADHLVGWLCEGDFPFWTGTRVTWEVSATATPGQTTLTFSHTGWPADYPASEFAHVNFTWGQIVARLKAYAETGQPQPYFPATAPAATV